MAGDSVTDLGHEDRWDPGGPARTATARPESQTALTRNDGLVSLSGRDHGCATSGVHPAPISRSNGCKQLDAYTFNPVQTRKSAAGRRVHSHESRLWWDLWHTEGAVLIRTRSGSASSEGLLYDSYSALSVSALSTGHSVFLVGGSLRFVVRVVERQRVEQPTRRTQVVVQTQAATSHIQAQAQHPVRIVDAQHLDPALAGRRLSGTA